MLRLALLVLPPAPGVFTNRLNPTPKGGTVFHPGEGPASAFRLPVVKNPRKRFPNRVTQLTESRFSPGAHAGQWPVRRARKHGFRFPEGQGKQQPCESFFRQCHGIQQPRQHKRRPGVHEFISQAPACETKKTNAGHGKESNTARKRTDPEELKKNGNEEYIKGRFAEALDFYNRAIALNPEKASYRSNKAAALVGLGRLLEAVGEYKEALRINPSLFPSSSSIGCLISQPRRSREGSQPLQAIWERR
ncbi:hypothetical protein HPP92_005240 [Vanilla planifolia]|uniref:Tetratricopeptide repeat protein n=1 Tax=Vanilla planifolia TaxID=51239 RepID=A0A835VF70_VANPL|nr:hypothetical protein HPP92_005240 [Vanilla planifolia]